MTTVPESVTALPESVRIDLGYIIDEAAADIVDFGWKADDGNGFPFDPYGDYPRCVWVAATRALERWNDDSELYASNYLKAVEDALLAAAGVPSLNALFKLNDSQPLEEGQAWAFGVLISASHILDPALAIGERKMDSYSTGKTDTGSTRSVSSRLLSFLKKFIWVR